MVPELGLLSLIIAAVFAAVLMSLTLVAFGRQRLSLLAYVRPLALGNFFFTSLSIVLLAYAFCQNDFSVMYVAQHSNSQLPVFYKIAALWGGHEGSILIWLFSLSFWLCLVAHCQRNMALNINVQVVAVMALLVVIFSLFILFLSNPFERVFPALTQGRDLNPMLQDIALIIHPPLLYLGYVGFAVSFSFAIVALINQQFDAAMAHWVRPWALASWLFLTAGIGLGAWWAYLELGWGGWWFWDPVENASLLPWLTGTALIHSLIASERRGLFTHWSLLLAIFTFSLSLLGTFVVRSGILTSIHAFAVDEERGLTLLLLLAVVVMAALLLFAFRAKSNPVFARFSFLSREAWLLQANVLFTIATLVVLLGTFYPLFFALAGLGSISVGAPYFNRIFTPLVILALTLMVFAPHLTWKRSHIALFSRRLCGTFIAALCAGGGLLFWLSAFQPMVLLLSTLCFWLLFSLWLRPFSSLKNRLAATLAHSAVALIVLGSVISANYTQEMSVLMTPDKTVNLAGFQLRYTKTNLLVGPNYSAEQIEIKILDQHNRAIGLLTPERRHYTVRGMLMSEPGVRWNMRGDIYAVLGEKVTAEGYAVRLYYKPMIRWVFAGGILLVISAVVALLSYRQRALRLKRGCENDE